MALLGSGDPDLQDRYQAVAKADAGRIAVLIGYDEALAHLIQAGADTIVVPSRFEPCGLTQLCALRYGAVPIVSRVGGLADTVVDVEEAGFAGSATTGLKFSPVTVENLASGLRRANILFHDKQAWRRLQHNGMSTDVSWRNRASRYAVLYREVVCGAPEPSALTDADWSLFAELGLVSAPWRGSGRDAGVTTDRIAAPVALKLLAAAINLTSMKARDRS